MSLYAYVKEKPKPNRKVVIFISYSSMIVGSLFLFWSFYPIIFFEIYSQLFIQRKVLTPVPSYKALSEFTRTNSILGSYSVFSTNLSDYTKAGIWFPSVTQNKNQDLKVGEYTLSIPRLNIANAKVIVGGEDLNKGLIHYAPKCLPGDEPCNAVIFGHSILPQLAKSGLDYKSIFTYLPSMEQGDKVLVTVDGATYEYKVIDIYVIHPSDVSVLDQVYDDSYLNLITCVPQGTYRDRLVVKAKLTKL